MIQRNIYRNLALILVYDSTKSCNKTMKQVYVCNALIFSITGLVRFDKL